MSDNDSKHDSELASYLDGSDGVSRAYGSLGQAEPPAALDARILAAARAANTGVAKAAEPVSRNIAPRWRGGVALAASLVLGVMIGTQVPRSAVVPEATSDVAMEKVAAPQGIQAQRAVADRAEEVQVGAVTGARIEQRAFVAAPVAAPPPAAVAEPDYRSGVLVWLQEITRLQARIEAGEAGQAQLDDERERFTARYPDIDLTLELESLAQVSSGD